MKRKRKLRQTPDQPLEVLIYCKNCGSVDQSHECDRPSMVTEKWSPNVLNDAYWISSYGRLARRKRERGTWPGKMLKGFPDMDGYLRFYGSRKTTKKGNTYPFTIHRSVALTFIGPCPDGKQVNHKDGVKLHNWQENLEYMTSQENLRHATEMGLKASGEKNHWARFKNSDVLLMRSLYDGGMNAKEVSRQLELPHTTVWQIVSRRAWRHLP